MTQEPSEPPAPAKKSSATKWIAVIIVVVVLVVAGVVATVELRPKTSTQQQPLSISPSTTAVATLAGTNIIFSPGLPAGATFTKLVWNFGNGHTDVVTTGNGIVNYSYSTPGSYLVSLSVYNKTSMVSNNNSLLPITVNPSLSANPAAVEGPIVLSSSSAVYDNASSTGNQTIGLNGWVNLTFGGLLDPTPLTVGSNVSGDTAYTIQSFTWNIDNGSQIIADNNTGLPETINVTFNVPGLHVVNLKTESMDSSTGQTVNGSYIMTIAAGNYSILVNVPKVSINTNLVVNAEYMPGGLNTLDPAIAYDFTSDEVIEEVYQPLVVTNGTSTTQFNPVIATNVPSVANGEVTSNLLNWTFYINTSIKFSNGDPVNAYDVYVSAARALLFANDPGTPGWTLAYGLLPAPTISGPFNESFYWIHHAITWNNTTQSVTFHMLPNTLTWLPNTSAVYAGVNYGPLNQSYPVTNYGLPTSFLLALWENPVFDVMDYKWLVQNGAVPQNTSASYAYWSNNTTSPGLLSNWNQYVHYHMMGTGPYYLALYEPATSVILKVNPYYNATQGMLPQSKLIKEVEIEYLTSEDAAQVQLETGEAQFGTGAFPISQTSGLMKYVDSGILQTAQVASFGLYVYSFNMAINVTGAQTYDSQTNIPSNFFANLSVRKAFAYAFNISYLINVSYSSDGLRYAIPFSGVFPPGSIDVPTNITSQYPQIYDLNKAKFYWEQTSYYKNGTKLYLPLFNVEGNPANDEMDTVWANAINAATNGQVTVLPVDISYTLWLDYGATPPTQDPMPLWYDTWVGFSPTTQYASPMLGPFGYDDWTDGFAYNTPGWNNTTNPNQWANITQMWNLLNLAAESTNSSQIALDYYMADVIAIKEFFYVGTMEPVNLVAFSTAINPASLADTENPVQGANLIIYYGLQYKS
ncbi:MAG: ABC transporter substrate-binding protein [Candidatus Thermoplasmatota archaeon]|nr:ABC transporter substrate-binding protein [Candidatus Thermoplasmatota archaeon]MCL5790181.1 ABC transporter substrate-binding protein [Candidatus Thermoplasmatota archaeon]